MKKKAFVFFIICFVICLSGPGLAADSGAHENTLKGGCVKMDITPPVGVWLSGYGARKKPSDGVYDKLYTKALVLEDGKTILAIVANDLLWVPLSITKQARKQIQEKTGIPEANILICGTHTHFGPKVYDKTILGPTDPRNTVDASYVKTLIAAMTESVVTAYRNRQEIKLGVAKGRLPEIMFNRRTRLDDGSVKMSFSLPADIAATRRVERLSDGTERMNFSLRPNDPNMYFGPIDPEVGVLRVEDAEGHIMASLINFACHPVSGSTYPDWFYSISADYPGQATEIVETVEGGICLFTLGTAGDMVPLQRGKEPRFAMGKALAGQVLRRLQFMPTTGNQVLKGVKKEISFPVKTETNEKPILSVGKTEAEIHTEIQVLRIGTIYLLGLPGEILVEVGLEIKKQADLENLFIVSLSNDCIGYVCHREAYDEGGYESGAGTNLAPGAGEIMVREALELLRMANE